MRKRHRAPEAHVKGDVNSFINCIAAVIDLVLMLDSYRRESQKSRIKTIMPDPCNVFEAYM